MKRLTLFAATLLGAPFMVCGLKAEEPVKSEAPLLKPVKITQPKLKPIAVEQPKLVPVQGTARVPSTAPAQGPAPTPTPTPATNMEAKAARAKAPNALDLSSATGPVASTSPAAAPSISAPPVEVTPPAGPLGLEESIEIALVNHGTVGVAREQFEGSAERVTSARAARAPQLNLEADYSASNRVGGVSGGFGTNSFSGSSTTTALVLRQNLFDSGVTRAQTRQAQANARGALFGIGQARSAIAFEVARTYFEQLRTGKLLALAREQVQLAEKNLELVRAQAEAGVAARVDQQPIEVELLQRRFNLTQAENNARTAQVNFRNALGLGRGPALPIQDVSATAPQIATVEAYFQEAQLYNPDLKIQRANVEASQASVDVASIRARPNISVDVSLAAGLFDSPRRSSGFGAGLTVPILDGGARRAERRAAQDQLQANQLREEQVAKDIAADIEAAYATAANARDSIAAARALEESARTNLEVAQEKYRQGLGIALEITTAQVQLFNAQISTIQALYNYYQAQAALERATGRRSGIVAQPATQPVAQPAPAPAPTP